MAYNQGGYGQQGQQGQQGYGSYNPYGQSGNPYGGQTQYSNPYEQQDQPYGHTGNYSERPDLHQQSSSRYDEESAQGSSYEMSNMNSRDPNRILNEVRSLDRAVDDVESEVQHLKNLRRAYLEEPNPSTATRDSIATMADTLLQNYRGLVTRVNRVRADPEAQNNRNKAQVGKIERRVKQALNQFQQADREYREASRAQIARQYRIVRPDASDAEIQEAVEDSNNGQVFSNALISSDRRGDAQTAATNVRKRHQDIQKIEKDMMELAQLFNDLETLVVQQEPAVAQIEEKGMEAQGHVAQANTELEGAVEKARAARRKKWYCLGIAVVILIIIILIAVLLGVLLNRK